MSSVYQFIVYFCFFNYSTLISSCAVTLGYITPRDYVSVEERRGDENERNDTFPELSIANPGSSRAGFKWLFGGMACNQIQMSTSSPNLPFRLSLTLSMIVPLWITNHRLWGHKKICTMTHSGGSWYWQIILGLLLDAEPRMNGCHLLWRWRLFWINWVYNTSICSCWFLCRQKLIKVGCRERGPHAEEWIIYRP